MLYTAEVRFDGAEIGDRLSEVTEWFRVRDLPVGPFKYTIRVEMLRLRVDFADLRDAAVFAEAFRGVVLGVSVAAETVA